MIRKKKYIKAKIPLSKYREAKVKGYKENKGEKREEAWSIFGFILPGCSLSDTKHGSKKPYVSHKKDLTMALGYDWKQTMK